MVIDECEGLLLDVTKVRQKKYSCIHSYCLDPDVDLASNTESVAWIPA